MPSFVRASNHKRGAAAVVVGVVVAAAFAHPTAARAQDEKKALAEALFQEGRTAFEAGDYPTACAKFDASQHLEAKLGTLLNLAACHEAEGRTASAWAEFTQAEAQAKKAAEPDREKFAHDHAADLVARLSRIRVITSEACDGLHAIIDDVALESAALGTAVPVDPGAHDVVVAAPGRHPFSTRVTATQGPSEVVVTVPPLAPEPPAPTPSPSPTPAPSHPPAPAPTPAPSPAPAPAPPPSRAPLVAGWATAGAGAAVLGVGSYLGLLAFAKNSDGNAQCDRTGCSQGGLDDFSNARTAATVSTIAFGVGLVAVATGLYLVFFTHAPPKVHASSRGTALEVSF